jgi:four helix bundle protein
MGTYLHLNDIDCYKRAYKLSNYVWDVVIHWEWFVKSKFGAQYTSAIDSISANIAEGFGRFTKKDKIRFDYIALGSVMESLDWTQKAKTRKLLTEEQYQHILTELQALPMEIREWINFKKEKLKQ